MFWSWDIDFYIKQKVKKEQLILFELLQLKLVFLTSARFHHDESQLYSFFHTNQHGKPISVINSIPLFKFTQISTNCEHTVFCRTRQNCKYQYKNKIFSIILFQSFTKWDFQTRRKHWTNSKKITDLKSIVTAQELHNIMEWIKSPYKQIMKVCTLSSSMKN